MIEWIKSNYIHLFILGIIGVLAIALGLAFDDYLHFQEGLRP